MNWTNEFLMKKVDAIVRRPYPDGKYGWHEDQASEYHPTIQQVRSEFRVLLEAIIDAGLVGGRCLQLGLGDGYSHEVWRCVFDYVCSVDEDSVKFYSHPRSVDAAHESFVMVQTANAVNFASVLCPFDFLFIDASHLYADVKADYENYSPLVRRGGIIAFHDALPRPGHEVYRFLEEMKEYQSLNIVGDEVGTAWMVKQ